MEVNMNWQSRHFPHHYYDEIKPRSPTESDSRFYACRSTSKSNVHNTVNN